MSAATATPNLSRVVAEKTSATSVAKGSQANISKSRLLLIDGHSLAFRAYYALAADSFVTATGQATNAVHGFTSMFLSLLENEKPTHVAVAFDLPGGTFRTKEYPEYKGTRDETPPPFIGQIELIEQVLTAFGIRSFTAPGFEADDILATLATRAQQQQMEVLICSGDRDSFQTITEHCTVLYPIKGVSVLRRMTPQEVEERYDVTPQQYPDLAALVGEKSDNLPGVPGVGPKTAAKWINLYCGLPGVIANAEQIKGKVGENLRAHLDDVVRNRHLNRLRTDLDLNVDPLNDLRWCSADRVEVDNIMCALEFKNLYERALKVLKFADETDSTVEFKDTDSPLSQLQKLDVKALDYQIKAGHLDAWLHKYMGDAGEPIGLDVVGTLAPAHPQADLLALSTATHALSVDLTRLLPEDEFSLSELLADPDRPKIVADAKGCWHALKAQGFALDGVIADVSLGGYLCRPEQRDYDVTSLSKRWLDIDLTQLDASESVDDGFNLEALAEDAVPAALIAAARRARVVLDLQKVLTQQMQKRGVLTLFNDLEMPVNACLAQMEAAGIAVDWQALQETKIELDARVNHAEQGAYAAAGHELNLSSPKQLQEVLFAELDMPKTRRTKTGYTTDAEALADLYARTSHPFLENLLEHRDAIKLRQTVEGLSKAVLADGRIHTTFQQTVAATGRLSSSEPNLQNIPARTAEGMRIREAFVVGAEYECLLTADYSQIEMRIMAHLSGDESLINAFLSGEDLHRYVAAMVHGLPVEQITTAQRNHVKAMSYGLAYGLSTYGLSRQLHISTAAAAALREAYFSRFGKVRDYLENVVKQARRDGWTQTMFGRRRYLPDLTSDNRQRRENAERAALNAPIQGSAADIVKKAMIDVADSLTEAGLKSRILLQIHDELLLEVAPGELNTVEELVYKRMTSAAQLRVPLEISMGHGTTWRSAAH